MEPQNTLNTRKGFAAIERKERKNLTTDEHGWTRMPMRRRRWAEKINKGWGG
jgi:hypothetical protein